MAHYLVELYTPKPAWVALDQNGRQRFFEIISSGMAGLSALGIEAVALGEIDATKMHAAPQQFFAIWRFPDEVALNALLSGIATSGWHNYFETINAAGTGTNLPGHLVQLLAAQG